MGTRAFAVGQRIGRLIVFGLVGLAGVALGAQGPREGPDPSLLQRLLQRHRPETRPFNFAAIGDQQYGPEGERKWPALQASINRDNSLAFTVHVGDFKSGATLCDNSTFADRFRAFNDFERPMIYTPGDNEWTDCHRVDNGSYNPLERLDMLRRFFFANNGNQISVTAFGFK